MAGLIVGGGPVGLALALDLGWRGVPCLLVEQGDGEIVDAKMFATGIRTVEFCRRWGIAEQVKHWGFPRDFPFDNVFVTSLAGHEIGRIADAADRGRSPPFAYEPGTLRALPAIRVRSDPGAGARALTHRSRCATAAGSPAFRDTGDGVVADLVDAATGKREHGAARAISSAATALQHGAQGARHRDARRADHQSLRQHHVAQRRPARARRTTRARPGAMSSSARKAPGPASRRPTVTNAGG